MLTAALAASLMTGSVVTASGAVVQPSRAAIDPRDVAALRSAKPAEPEPEGVSNADFTPLAGRDAASRFDPKRSKVVDRTAFTTEYENPDGTRTIQQSTQPVNVKDAAGQWHGIDTALAVDQKGERVAPKRQGLSPSLAEQADDSSLVSVEVEGKRVSLGLAGAASSKVEVDGSKARYRDALPQTDVEYEVTSGEVKETIVLKSRPEANTWRFHLDAGGLAPTAAKDGTVRFTDDQGALRLVMPPIETWDSTGDDNTPPAMTGGAYGLERDGDRWALTVSVDRGWLDAPNRKYPVRVDPTFSFGVIDSVAYRTDGTTCQNCGLRIGNSQAAGDTYNRTALRFDYSPLFGRTVVGARMDFTRNTSVVGSVKTWDTSLYHASSLDINGLGALLATGPVGDVGTFSDPRLTGFLRHVVDTRQGSYFMLVGSEVPGTWTYKHLYATLTVDVGSAPPAAVLSAPADGSVITSLTPSLKVNPVNDPDGDAVTYCFTVATGPDARSGVVVDSGCLTTPTWTLPPNVLQDGVAYTWLATTYSGATTTTPAWVGHFRVDQRIGARGPAPVDTVGPITVNLANGNASTTHATPTFNTVAGDVGLTFAYNSHQAEPSGLKASYFVDLSHNGLISDSQQPVLVRTEPQVNVNWATESPFAPALAADWFVVRWEGYFQAPVAGSYQFAGAHDDGAVIWVNGTKVYDVANPSEVNWTQTTAVNLTAGQRVPIKVEAAERQGDAMMRLFTRTSDGTTVPPQIVPSGWLHSADLPVLPKGWTLSVDLDGGGIGYTEARITDQTIVLTDASGAKHTWTKKSTGGYAPPEGETGVLGLDTSGRVTLTEGADVLVFRADGKLETKSTVVDSRKPAALQNLYDGVPSRLREIKDPVSGRSHQLHYNRAGDDCYGGATPPSGVDALPPGQMLCRVVYWDGSQTRLWYVNGNLARIEDPGSDITDYGYSAQRTLTDVRTSLVNDWIAADPAARQPEAGNVTYAVSYDTSERPRATRVVEPEPAPGAARPARSYRHDPPGRTTFVDVAGLNPMAGYHSKVTYDDAERELSTTDATGATSRHAWNVKDQKLFSTDPAGRVTTTVYDYAERPTDTYGPAPASCFTGQLPTTACAATVPHTRTGYDEGINGLFASFYANSQLSGAPKVFTTGTGSADGSLINNWARNAPVPDIPADGFSLRLNGEIVFPEEGDYKLRLFVDDGIRVWVDDKNVIDDWRGTTAAWRETTVHSDGPGSIKRIRLDYLEIDLDARLELHWTTPGGTQQPVPGSQLRPRYGLTTSTVTAESGGVPDQTTATRYSGLDPVFGRVDATVADPAGLGLTTGSGYEQPGSGYLRKTGKTMPNGAQTTYTYYQDTETRANPCASGSPAVNQGGMAKLTTAAAPATGSARTDEQIYDASGRVVAKSTSGDWSCTSYDGRDRVVQQTFPANAAIGARTVTHDYAVGGDPLTTSVSDYNGTVTTKVDLLGRVVQYLDNNGTDTTTTYDQAGRVVGTSSDPSLSNDAPRVTATTYDDAGRVRTVQVNDTVQAIATYDTAGELATVVYPNNTSLTSIGRDLAGRTTSLIWKTSDGNETASAVTRTRAGTIIDESLAGTDANPSGPNYVYDATGRLTEEYAKGHHFTYDFTSAAPAGCPTGARATAGRNTNRVRALDQTAGGTAETGYCYDDADRLLATTGATTTTDVTYDSHGNTRAYETGGTTTYLRFDSADRNIGLSAIGPDRADVSYVRDATNRITRRDAGQGDEQTAVLYGYDTAGDSAIATMDVNHHVLTWTQALPGGVVWTEQNSQAPDNWDLPTVRGDLFATVQNGGLVVGDLHAYDAYGQPLAQTGAVDPDNVPDNQPGQMDYGWLGQHRRPYEHAGALSAVQMGARPYSPLLGRFLAVDPVEGGSANDYDYTNADPLNTTDLDGNRASRSYGSTWKRAPSPGLGVNCSQYEDRGGPIRILPPRQQRERQYCINSRRVNMCTLWECLRGVLRAVGNCLKGVVFGAPSGLAERGINNFWTRVLRGAAISAARLSWIGAAVGCAIGMAGG